MVDSHSLTEWRLLDTGHRNAAENMALDDVILECRARDLVPNTIRFLQFDPAAVLVGYNQSIHEEVRIDFCNRRGIDINRRLTGGGAIFFDPTSLGWEVIAAKSDLDISQPSTQVFEWMCQGVINALQMLGIPASFRSKNDIEVNRRKISGTGGTERDGAFLFQGTLLIDFDVNTMLRALKIPIMKLKDKEITSVKERVTCVQWEIKDPPTIKHIKQTLKMGFEQAFHMKLTEGPLSHDETLLLRHQFKHFQSSKWVHLDRRPPNFSNEVSTIEKTPGGLIRISLSLNRISKVIKNAFITGDFFVFPSRAIFDLEAKLKYAPYDDEDQIATLVHDFFVSKNVHIPGIPPENLIALILKTVDKIKYESLGLTLKEANHIYPINKDVLDTIDQGCEALLLPYCAKLTTCPLRYEDGCTKCGDCSVGQAYELAEQRGLIPITIKNFNHLMTTLKTLEQKGVRGYLGCCCEGFYCKHQEDLKQAKIPGILIDIDDQTCYDLGREDDALKGSFESQTELKINLLSKLMEIIQVKNGRLRVGKQFA